MSRSPGRWTLDVSAGKCLQIAKELIQVIFYERIQFPQTYVQDDGPGGGLDAHGPVRRVVLRTRARRVRLLMGDWAPRFDGQQGR